jgi:tripartite-type tricarboxylate transporter receptor subunit TctC
MRAFKRFSLLLLGVAVLLAGSLTLRAQDYPTKAVRVLVPYPAGGQSDVIMRLIADSLREQFNTPFVVENRPGAATTLAAETVARSAPDGYTLLLAAASTTAIAPATIKGLTFDPKKLTPITLIAKIPYILVASKSFQPNTIAELVAYAKANPGKINWATHGLGGAQHLTGEMFNKAAGIDMTAIHYQGSAPGTLDMIAGRIDLMFDGAGTGLPNVRSGQLKAIAMGSDTRAAGAPDLPTWKEGGVNMSAYTWYGIFVPVGTPQPIMEKLYKAITVAIDSKAYKERLASAEAEIPHMSIAETTKFVDEDAVAWVALIKLLNLKLE